VDLEKREFKKFFTEDDHENNLGDWT